MSKKVLKNCLKSLFVFNVCLLFALFLYLLLLNTADYLFDGDTNWLLRTGEYILQTGNIPSGDFLSWSKANEPIVIYQWLFTVLIALAKQSFPQYFFLKLFTLLYVTSYILLPLFFCYKKNIPLIIPVILSSLALVMLMQGLTLRPQIFTCLFLGLQYLLIYFWQEKKISFKVISGALVLVYILWGNIHTGVILGLVLFVLQIAGGLLDRRNIKPLILLTVVCCLVSLINPYGIGIYEHLFHIAVGESELNNYIIELKKYNFLYLVFLIPFIVLFITKKSKKFISWQDVVICVAFTIMAFFSNRLILFASLFYIFVFAQLINNLLVLNNKNVLLNSKASQSIILMTLFVSCSSFLFINNLTDDSLVGRGKKYQPTIQAFSDIYRENPGRDINTGVIGSYFLSSKTLKEYDYKAGLDTRYDFYHEHALETIKLFRQEERNIKDVITFMEAKNVRYIVDITETSSLYKKLKKSNDFKLLYEDQHACIFELLK